MGNKRVLTFFRDLKFQSKLIFIFLLLVLIPFIILGLLSFRKSSDVLMQEVIGNSTQLVKQVTDKIDYNMQEIDKNTLLFLWDKQTQSILGSHFSRETLRKRKENQMDMEAAMQTFLNTRLEIESVYMYRNDGDEYYIDNSPSGSQIRERILMKRNEIYAETLKYKGKYNWMTLNLDKELISGSRIIYDTINLNQLGLLIINLQENYIRDLYSDIRLSPNGFFVVSDQSGRIISTNSSLSGDELTEIMRNGAPRKLQNLKYDYSGTKYGNYFIIKKASEFAGWNVSAVIPKDELLGGINNIASNIIVTGVLCTLMSVILLLLLSSFIIRPVNRLMDLMKRVEQEDFNVKAEVNSKDELGELTYSFNKMIDRIRYLIEEVYKGQIVKKEAEFKMLQAQINPHFLYNTLDSINWIAKINGVEDISKMVVALGQLMRISIAKGKGFLPLEQELEYINNYLIIQSMRYRDKFITKWEIDEAAKKRMVPKMLLQPLIENALVHGIEKKIGKGEIIIRAVMSEGKIKINVIDDGVGMDKKTCEEILKWNESEDETVQDGFHTGIGLANVDRRIKMMYGQEYGLNISSLPGYGTDVQVTLPIIEPGEAIV